MMANMLVLTSIMYMVEKSDEVVFKVKVQCV